MRNNFDMCEAAEAAADQRSAETVSS